LFHKASKILLITDLGANISEGLIKLKNSSYSPLIISYAKKVGITDGIGVSSAFKYLIKDKNKVKQSLERICSWDFNGIGMAHGVPILPSNTSDVKALWRSSFEQLL